MTKFFRFPHTPHLAWLGSGLPRDDKILSQGEATKLLSHNVVIEEKLDGANLGVSADENGKLRLQNRGQYLLPPFAGQFSRVAAWLAKHEFELSPALGNHLILFGEWCAARHSVSYDHLPDWFLAFDVYDRANGRFWNVNRRDEWLDRVGVTAVPTLTMGRTTLDKAKALVMAGTSRSGNGPLEGIVIRRDEGKFLEQRAKLVRPDFTQEIGEHWRGRRIEWNRVAA